MSILHVEDANFTTRVVSGVVLVDFYTDRCGPCRMLAPILEELATLLPQLQILKMDADNSPVTAREFRITAVPTLIIFKNGQAVERKTGLWDLHSLQRWILPHL